MAQKIFEGLRKFSNWSLQKLNFHQLPLIPLSQDLFLTDPLYFLEDFLNGNVTYNFDGTYYLENTDPASLPTGDSERSMFGWIAPANGSPIDELGLFGYGPPDSSSGNDHFFTTLISGTNFHLGDDNYNDSTILPTNRYTLIGMTWNGTDLTIYVNNNSATYTPAELATSAGYIRVGLGDYWANTCTGLFKGAIVDVGIWSRCLGLDEIAALYAAGPQPYSSLPQITGGLVDESVNSFVTNNGAYLDTFFAVGKDATSYWNLSEISGTRYDSINYPDGNNLNEVDITTSFTYSPTYLVVSFTDTSVLASSWDWNFGDSGTSTDQNPTYTYAEGGTYTVSLETNVSSLASIQTLTVAAHMYPIWQQIDLSSYFNTVGITQDGYSYTGDPGYGLDGATPGTDGNNFSGSSLQNSYPAPLSINGVGFALPVANWYGDNVTNNVIYCEGQTLALSGISCDYIYLLGFATDGSYEYGTVFDTWTYNSPFTVVYSDTSTATFEQSMSDWFAGSGNHYSNEDLALSGLYKINSTGDNSGYGSGVYLYSFAVDRDKVVDSIILPNSPYILSDGASTGYFYIVAITEAISVPEMLLWAKADSLNLNNGDGVGELLDLSGNDHTLFQVNIPTFATNVINGLPAIQFTASELSGDSYDAGQFLYAYISQNIINYSVIAVVKQVTPTGKFKVAVSWGFGGGINFWTGYIPDDAVGPPGAYAGALVVASDSVIDVHASAVDDTNWHICEGVFDGTNLCGWDTGTAAIGTSGNCNNSNVIGASTTLCVGCYNNSLFWNGYIAEVMFFYGTLSDNDRQAIESYLISRYGL